MPEFNFEAQFLDTVGLEGESVFLSKEVVSDGMNRALSTVFPNRRVVNIGRDASAEMFVENLFLTNSRKLQISTHTSAANLLEGMGRDRRTIGYEFWTNPLPIKDMEKFLFPAMFFLVGQGDSVSDRAASHIHVGFAHNLRLMKRLLRICLAFDPILFRLAGMGGVFRGWKNHAAYARPLMHSGVVRISRGSSRNNPSPVIAVPDLDSRGNVTGRITRRANPEFVEMVEQEIAGGNSQLVKIINPIAALGAKDLDEFWASFGVNVSNLTKYHPSRYTAMNFYAILAHGTMEFRHPNASLDPQLLLAMIKFLRAMVEVSTLCSKEEILSFEILPSNVQVSMGDATEIIFKILNLCRKHEVENLPTSDEMDIIISTLEISTFIPLPETPVLTHINDFLLSERLATTGKLEFVEKVLPPNHVDIHNIDQKESSIFDTFPEVL